MLAVYEDRWSTKGTETSCLDRWQAAGEGQPSATRPDCDEHDERP